MPLLKLGNEIVRRINFFGYEFRRAQPSRLHELTWSVQILLQVLYSTQIDRQIRRDYRLPRYRLLFSSTVYWYCRYEVLRTVLKTGVLIQTFWKDSKTIAVT
jgi:hypothetical protein